MICSESSDYASQGRALERGRNRTHSAGMGEEQSNEVGTTVEARPAPATPPRFSFYIDIFGYCNLRCPSCPVGNWEDDASVFHHGVMSRALLETILDKAMAECTIAGVALFNWTEPLLHPAVHELIAAVRARAVHCAISTNLHVLREPDLLMRANPGYGSRFRDSRRRSTRAGTRLATSKW
jgi:hypothetical protein